ncbi:hypothetical protein [Microbacterium hominis]|uniref:Chain-length determining protein n=1 Tax=Microbacterium hominis TaxID=162426 RepID=A0A7D4UC69_9MICO|nr:hypothetical protein [Microbacterium hominis]QKJ20283.1 hypothetical protein HQM25_13560 [Microbacterium hominis]
MDTPKYLQVLWGYKWLLLFGAVVAGVAAFFAGFTVVNGEVTPRAEKTWSAATTMLLTSPTSTLFQAEVPGVPIEQGTSDPQVTDLAENALVYAYIISSDALQDSVEASIGTLDDETEAISALRRTTQPTGDERFPGRYDLPVLEAVGTAATAERAEEISQTAADEFVAYLVAQQDTQEIAPEQRVQVEMLGLNPAVEGDSSNPAIPVVVTFFGVFLAFVVLAFSIAGIRGKSARRKAAKAEAAAAAAAASPAEATPDAADELPLDDLIAEEDRELVSTGASSRRANRPPRDDDGEGA